MTSLSLPAAPAIARDYRTPIVDGLFLATVATVTFAKLQWEVGGDAPALGRRDRSCSSSRSSGRASSAVDGRMTRAAGVTLGFFVAFLDPST